MRARQNANASMAKGIACKEKAKKTEIMHLCSSLIFSAITLFPLSLYLSISISFIAHLIWFYWWISKMTAHKTP